MKVKMAGPIVMLDKDCGLQGKLQYTKSRDKPVYTYLGVPYAEPPVGTRRFKPTVPLKLWNGIRDATKFGACCPQNKEFSKNAMPRYPVIDGMSEDCLFLNVYTPKSPPDDEMRSSGLLPVMVWIHGGGMMIGCSNYYEGTVLTAKHDVIVVTLNYRVNIFGFLTTPDGYISGNMGMLDQVEALKWVQTYIYKFGGDPNNVTIFGESAGGMCASLHMISPLSKGLFQRVICESGSALYSGMLASTKRSGDIMKKRFQPYDVDYTNGPELENFLMKMDSTELVSKFFGEYWCVIDGTFLPSSQLSLFKANGASPVDLLCGFTSDEGNLMAAILYPQIHAPNYQWERQSVLAMVQDYIAKYILPDYANLEEINTRVRELYFDQCTNPESYHRQVLQIMGDVLFEAPTVLLANFQNKKAKTFVYEFRHRPCYSKLPPWAFADHVDDIPYVFGEPYSPSFKEQWSDEDVAVTDMTMKYWTNFAKTGDPNGSDLPQWPRYESDKQQYIVLKDKPEICGKRKREKLDLWNRTYEKTE